ncbi:ATP-grasp domain-containing protein [Sphingopyxis kveilinensis]|uniref:ATP-grasp domain-containing protein n=1 Tax=Sphingopyxis kveilinensis TaxID=3114367 RepID=UPI0030D25F66
MANGGEVERRGKLTMMISSAGRRGELLQCFRASAAELGISLTILACDLEPEWSAACQLANRSFAVPRADSADYVPALLSLCSAHGVDLLVPTIDTELLALSESLDRFRAEGIWVSVGEPSFVRMARDKMATAQALGAINIATPATFPLAVVRNDPARHSWPMIVKPNHGSASRLISIATSADDLPAAESEPLIVQQLLSGPEYTINMFFDRNGKVRTVIPHRRVRTRAGEVEKGVTERHRELCRIGWELGSSLEGVRGVICFQAIVTDDGPFVFEINARFGGGYPLAHAAGAPFARWLLEETAGLESTTSDDWREDIRMLRYDAAVFSQT